VSHTVTQRDALCFCLHTITGTLAACICLHLWATCGKACGFAAPASVKPIERPRNAR
jgi:hypothetical protein